MKLRLLHTSDWHLGQTLHQWSRQAEHQAFLHWLQERLIEYQVDALIVAGDIFDVSNPPAFAIRDFFSFLAGTRQRLPTLDMVIVGGNHDSASRLDSSNPVLQALDIHVVGGIPRKQNEIDYHAMCIPIRHSGGQIAAWCGAMPFIRMTDLGSAALQQGPALLEAYHQMHQTLAETLLQHRQGEQALIMTGHTFMRGGAESPDSERRLTAGNLEGLPLSMFPPEIDYVALGHLHRAQMVGDQPHIRYSGSPIPLSLPEGDYEQQCLLIDLEDRTPHVQTLTVPRHTPMWRIPKEGPVPPEKIPGFLETLPHHSDNQPIPYLEIRVLLEKPHPGLHRQMEQLLEGKSVHLVKISPTYPQLKATEPAWTGQSLQELDPLNILYKCYQQKTQNEPSEAVVKLFQMLLEQSQEELSN